jgi:hypothetical protein
MIDMLAGQAQFDVLVKRVRDYAGTKLVAVPMSIFWEESASTDLALVAVKSVADYPSL